LYVYVILLPSMNITFFNIYDVSKKEITWWFVSGFYYSFETWPGRSTRDLADPGLEPGRVKKKRQSKTRPTRPVALMTRLTWQDSVKNSVTTHSLFFFTKTISYLFIKKIKIDPGFKLDRPLNKDSVKNSVTIHSLIFFFQNNIIFIYKKIKINSGFELDRPPNQV
jgi:hypothetical protein